MDNLKKINYKPMMKSLGFSRFVANVNKQFMRRKMNEIATFHYMHSVRNLLFRFLAEVWRILNTSLKNRGIFNH